MSELKLLPCPFCGGEATIDNAGGKYQAWCKYCCCIHMGEFYNTEAEAITAWNRRAQPENEPLVRCGNCKHYNRIGCADGFGWCERMDRGTNDDFYCSLVERSEG